MNASFNILPISIYNSCQNPKILQDWDVMLPTTLLNKIFKTLFTEDNINKYIVKIADHIFNPTESHDDPTFENCIFVNDDICEKIHTSQNINISIIYNLLNVKKILLKKVDENDDDPNFKQMLTNLLENIKVVQKGKILKVSTNTFVIQNIIFDNEPVIKNNNNRYIALNKTLALNSAIFGYEVGLQECNINVIDYEWEYFANKNKQTDQNDSNIFGTVTNNNVNEIEIDFVDVSEELAIKKQLQRIIFKPPQQTITPIPSNKQPSQINQTYDTTRFPGVGRRLGSS